MKNYINKKMKEGIIKLTEQEANELITLIDIANKVKGLEKAESCLYFLKKIQQAFEVKKEELELTK